MINIIVIGLFYIWIFFIFIRALLKLPFKPLTAHWIAVGLCISYVIGLLMFAPFQNSEKLLLFEDVIEYLAVSWVLALIPLNFFVLPFLYFWDKRIALKNSENSVRIPENAFHALTFSGGVIGSFIGQKVFYHKISKHSFQIKHYVVCALSVVIYISCGYMLFTI